MRILQTACTVHLCFVFILCFVCRDELSEFVFPLDVLSSSISGVPAPLLAVHAAHRRAGKNLLERLLQHHVLFTTSFVFGLIIWGEDAILIKYFQYLVYDIDG